MAFFYCCRKFVKASYDIEFENLEAKIRKSFMKMMKRTEKDATLGELLK
jgi:PHYB activation tagged suppressor 1